MKMYQTLPDMSEKEKVIGGILNLYQFFWILGGIGLGAVLFLLTFKFNLTLSGFLLILGIISGVPFAFVKPKGLYLFTYLMRKRSFNKKVKKLPNIRGGH